MLQALTLTSAGMDTPDLAELLQLLPALLPHISSLSIPQRLSDTLPDLSRATSIRSLHIPAIPCDVSTLRLLLPPKLQHLSCHSIHLTSHLAALTGSGSLTSLRSVQLAPRVMCDLHVLALLLQAAPLLQRLEAGTPDEDVCVSCDLSRRTAEDLMVLSRRLDIPTHAHLHINCDTAEDAARPEHALLHSWPRMAGIARCSLTRVRPDNLARILAKFPGIWDLEVTPEVDYMDDLCLQGVKVCERLRTLRISRCPHVSPMGVMALCLGLPSLDLLVTVDCVQLQQGAAMSSCQQLLRQHGRYLTVVDAAVPESQAESDFEYSGSGDSGGSGSGDDDVHDAADETGSGDGNEALGDVEGGFAGVDFMAGFD